MKFLILILASFLIIAFVVLWMHFFDILDRWDEERERREQLESLEPMNIPSEAEIPAVDLATTYLLVADGEPDMKEKAYWYKRALTMMYYAARGGGSS